MASINVNLPQQSYEIAIGQTAAPEGAMLPEEAAQRANAPEGIDQLGEMMSNLKLGKKVLLVSNPTIFKHYGERAIASLEAAGFEVASCTLHRVNATKP
jgi:3-dehydroquinate synthase